MSNSTSNKAGGNAPVKAGPAEPLKTSIERRIARLEMRLAESSPNGLPVWIRPPKSGPEHFTGLSRSKLYEGAQLRHFRSISLREPGQIKGTRLFELAGILNWIARHEVAPAEGSER